MFHIVFGKSVPDISHNATANLGYADVRFSRPVYPGDTLHSESEVIGLREVSSGEQGVVYVRTRGTNQKGQEVLSFIRWVMVPKRDKDAARGINQAPQLPSVVTPDRLPVPEVMNLQRFPDSKPSDDWGIRPDPGRELPLSVELGRQLKEWYQWQVLRPYDSREALPLDDPENDPQRQAAFQMLRGMAK